ncbi:MULTISPECIES: toll/interleukin-1 receptor domain-containing protein [unclassified Microcoleus]|uniref:toll/interleukin-1 receptor domain-containing protein n=1 Tax=unclassified Microcoleus TaxID=2642155 RepID=UPI0025FFF22C|nr:MULTISPECIES: toll/interleukin-1 receptor domain-containing protein [unclassified Microcoleus]
MVNQQYFDVFFTYNSPDEIQVLNVANKLRELGLNPWVKAEQIQPGTCYQDVIQQAIQSINCAAIFLGSGEMLEFALIQSKVHMSETVERGKKIIPVLLPGVDKIPKHMLFLQQVGFVDFANGIDDRKAIKDLVWAITNQKPDKSTEQETEQNFDVLLCYNQEDQFTVKNIANQLKQKQIRPWLDIWEVPGGVKSYEQLEKDIERIRSVAFLIGSNGCPWQKDPLISVIEEFFERDVRLIPVILKNVPPEPKLPIYLKRKRSVDFRHEESEPLKELIWAIRNS